MKKILKQILTFSFILAASLLIKPHLTFAEYSCADLNNQSATLKGKVVVINEERLGAPSDTTNKEGTTILNCFRKSTCTYKSTESKDSNTPPSQAWYCDGAGGQAVDKPGQQPLKYTVESSCIGSARPLSPTVGATYNLCEAIQVYISDSGLDLLYSYIAQIYRYAATTGGIVSVFFIILGGIQVSASGDDQDRLTKAKTLIIRSLSGLVLLFLSALILYTINPNFFSL